MALPMRLESGTDPAGSSDVSDTPSPAWRRLRDGTTSPRPRRGQRGDRERIADSDDEGGVVADHLALLSRGECSMWRGSPSQSRPHATEKLQSAADDVCLYVVVGPAHDEFCRC